MMSLYKAGLPLVAVAAGALIWRFCGSSIPTPERDPIDLSVRIVTYTVPFENYREHAGFVWLLNHLRVPAPGTGLEDTDNKWDSARDYIGYRPTDRKNPQRISAADLSAVDVVYIADTYGVYKDDLKGIEEEKAHMDYSQLVFGGLSAEDAQALTVFVEQGGVLMAEFNSFASPTSEEARALMEELTGTKWTGWVGRFFADPHNPDDAPGWLEREFVSQHPGQELPQTPILLFAHVSGRLEIATAGQMEDLVPIIEFTDLGAKTVPKGKNAAPYFYWFGIMEAQEEASVFAEFVFPENDALATLLAKTQLPKRMPMLIRSPSEAGVSYYFAGDLADIDFDPGPYDSGNVISRRAQVDDKLRGPTTAPSYWKFYAPSIVAILEEHAARKASEINP